jgi:hypothetical protein
VQTCECAAHVSGARYAQLLLTLMSHSTLQLRLGTTWYSVIPPLVAIATSLRQPAGISCTTSRVATCRAWEDLLVI